MFINRNERNKEMNNYFDKFNMTRESNIFLAKRDIVDLIWKSCHIEGINITFPETQRIYNGGNISRLRIDEIQTINNLKHAWNYLLNSLDTEDDINFIKSINSLIGSNLIDRAGEIRIYEVKMGGTSWKPEIPDENKVKENLAAIKENSVSITDQAITKMLYLMKTQFFNDGNKRTSMLLANKILISNGKGILNVPIELDVKFGELLINYYETNDMEKIKRFFYENCLDGINQDLQKGYVNEITKNNKIEENTQSDDDELEL